MSFEGRSQRGQGRHSRMTGKGSIAGKPVWTPFGREGGDDVDGCEIGEGGRWSCVGSNGRIERMNGGMQKRGKR